MSDDLGYTRVAWKRKNEDGVLLEEEGVIPLCWLEGKDIVRYPPKAKKERALRKKQIPQQDWMYGKLVHRKVTGSLDTCESWAYTTCATSSGSDEKAIEESKFFVEL
ncbi:uncharacterized protein LOC136095241 [Hydra vulgaris]|uniref:uncharacterized protein LOC136095241 n=1 Tax=Hydra vulgaris TaxID=6087 RepID=UPI0032EA5B4D